MIENRIKNVCNNMPGTDTFKGLRLGCGIKANCQHVGPGFAVEVPSVVFLRDPARIYAVSEKTLKTPNG